MLLVSVGTGRVGTGAGTRRGDQMNLLFHAISVPDALMESISYEQDMICRTLGYCRVGEEIDSELGDFRDIDANEAKQRKFTYLRYDHAFTDAEMEQARKQSKAGISLDNISLIPFLQQIGTAYADEHVKSDNLL